MESSLLETLIPLVKKHWIPVILLLSGLIFFVYGLITLLGTTQKPADTEFDSNLKTSPKILENLIAVDIEGQVVKTGVYKLKQNSIIQDVLIASGGLNELADRNWVAKNLNLALKITEGQKIYIPKQGEAIPVQTSEVSNPNDQTTNSNLAGLININTASEQNLDSLPGVGPVTAGKIINARPYSVIDDLINRKVVSQKVFNQIKDRIIAQ